MAAPRLEAEKPHPDLSGSAPPPPAENRHPALTPSTLHRAPVGQGPSGSNWLATALGFWSGRALATGTALAGLCLIHHHCDQTTIFLTANHTTQPHDPNPTHTQKAKPRNPRNRRHQEGNPRKHDRNAGFPCVSCVAPRGSGRSRIHNPMRETFRWSEIKNLDVGYRNRERTVDPAVVPSLEWRDERRGGGHGPLLVYGDH